MILIGWTSICTVNRRLRTYFASGLWDLVEIAFFRLSSIFRRQNQKHRSGKTFIMEPLAAPYNREKNSVTPKRRIITIENDEPSKLLQELKLAEWLYCNVDALAIFRPVPYRSSRRREVWMKWLSCSCFSTAFCCGNLNCYLWNTRSSVG